MAEVELRKAFKRYGSAEVIHGVDMKLPGGEFIVFVGPSGCGKSTLLRMIAGLEDISEGSIHIKGRDVTHVEAVDRGIAMVFQSYALYPHMTVEENMGFGLRMGGAPKDEVASKVADAAKTLQLDQLLDRKPKNLSGGQRQRVAIGRAIVRNPDVFLFDEPLSNLDAELRVEMRLRIAQLHNQLDATMIYVTHDQVEAMTMADKIVVLNQGVVEQMGPPMELYRNPKTRFVADFIGSPGMNFMPVDIRDNGLYLADVRLRGYSDGQKVSTIGIRPEHIRIRAPDSNIVNAVVRVKETLGGEAYIYARHELSSTDFVIKTDGEDDVKSGDTLGLDLPIDRQHLFDVNDKAVQ